MSKTNKFSEAFVKSKNITVDALTLIEMENGDIPKEYDLKNDLYCPECHEPLLSIINRMSGKYLRRSLRTGNPKHHNCSYELHVATHQEVKRYVEEKNRGEISQDLVQLLLKDNAIRIRDVHANDVIRKTNNRLVYTAKDANDHERKRIAQQKLNNLFIKNLETGVNKYYYGRVQLTNRRENVDFVNYTVKSVEKSRLFSMGIPKYCENLIDEIDAIFGDKKLVVVDLAIFSEIKVKEGMIKNHKVVYRDATIQNESYCLVKKVIGVN
ncbi:hypothetical protein [Lactiplantibacillus herbarum]|uniref:hypothetical protein n=1 Tax=Lactiplantibacillus herbarum TaxID=1670446 RepID=UPI00064E7481|nr:hypothetical protein [Lactiplantibacillus herbarum]